MAVPVAARLQVKQAGVAAWTAHADTLLAGQQIVSEAQLQSLQATVRPSVTALLHLCSKLCRGCCHGQYALQLAHGQRQDLCSPWSCRILFKCQLCSTSAGSVADPACLQGRELGAALPQMEAMTKYADASKWNWRVRPILQALLAPLPAAHSAPRRPAAPASAPTAPAAAPAARPEAVVRPDPPQQAVQSSSAFPPSALSQHVMPAQQPAVPEQQRQADVQQDQPQAAAGEPAQEPRQVSQPAGPHLQSQQPVFSQPKQEAEAPQGPVPALLGHAAATPVPEGSQPQPSPTVAAVAAGPSSLQTGQAVQAAAPRSGEALAAAQPASREAEPEVTKVCAILMFAMRPCCGELH